jgi:hypothetical protein
MEQIGSVPLYLNPQTGEVNVDPEDVNEVAESGRIGRRRGRGQAFDAPIADVYQAAAAAGMINENQYNGLGNADIAASGTGSITDTINRNLWGKSLVLDSDDAPSILVTSITIAGLPLNAELGTAARRAIEESLNDIAWNGVAELGIPGILTFPFVPRYTTSVAITATLTAKRGRR